MCISFPRGLSPRVRGHHGFPDDKHQHKGSIPACAGSPVGTTASERPERVYPRVCGVTEQENSDLQAPQGLSPRVRGHLGHFAPFVALFGSIPACAGSPWSSTAEQTPMRVYPRVCGVTGNSSSDSCRPQGLSPRVRGHRSSASRTSTFPGSIPACAGSPACQPASQTG